MYTIVKFTNSKYQGEWTGIKSIEDAIELIDSLKISGAGSTFSIENQDGTVVEVIRK